MFNMNQMMKQFEAMQKQMQEMQERIASNEYTGKAGGNMVSITITGNKEMKSVFIDPAIFSASEKEVLEDLIIAAYNDAKSKSDSAASEVMSNMMGGLNLPPGFKLPF